MIRFANGTPTSMWFSQHASGQAFTYAALEKKGKRPLSYSGNGTHANYAVKGSVCPLLSPSKPSQSPANHHSLSNSKHDHTISGINLPTGFLIDYTDRGVLWDPTLNAYAYTYDPSTAVFNPSGPDVPVAWLEFNGRWGDDQPPGEPEIFGEAKYVAGPDGPKFKVLNRKLVCPSSPCVVLPFRIFAG